MQPSFVHLLLFPLPSSPLPLPPFYSSLPRLHHHPNCCLPFLPTSIPLSISSAIVSTSVNVTILPIGPSPPIFICAVTVPALFAATIQCCCHCTLHCHYLLTNAITVAVAVHQSLLHSALACDVYICSCCSTPLSLRCIATQK